MLLLLTICIFLSLLCPLPAWASPEEASSLRLVQGEWAHEVRGMDDYDPNPEGRFKRGERGYAYIVVEGFDVGQDGEYYFLHLSVDVALETKGGIRLFSRRDIYDLEEWYLEPPGDTWFYIYVDIPWWAPRGTYVAVITIHDLLAGTALEERREVAVY
ncbi:MAG: hypothetical protein PHG88_01460 [Limnochordia bacterium]|nr:hypothetical protein [Limnochordia bacterium]